MTRRKRARRALAVLTASIGIAAPTAYSTAVSS
jgi:hypothetical protein